MPEEEQRTTEDLVNETVAKLRERLTDLITGTAEDIQAFLIPIGGDLVTFGERNDSEALDELVDQLEALGEDKRIQAVGAGWASVKDVVAALGDGLRIGIQAVMGGILGGAGGAA